MYGHDPQHTGKSPYVGVQTNSVRWQFQTGWWFSGSAAVGSDGTICFAPGNHLYALNSDGTIKWSALVPPPPYHQPTFGGDSPLIAADGTIYIGSGLNQTLYVFDKLKQGHPCGF